jgi:hypothetical protein
VKKGKDLSSNKKTDGVDTNVSSKSSNNSKRGGVDTKKDKKIIKKPVLALPKGKIITPQTKDK